jgi:transcriptional regulator with XRE-family HTH domain
MTYNDLDVLDMLRGGVKAAGSEQELAGLVGVSYQYINMVMNGHRPPGPKVLRYLGLKRVRRPPPPAEYVRDNG